MTSNLYGLFGSSSLKFVGLDPQILTYEYTFFDVSTFLFGNCGSMKQTVAVEQVEGARCQPHLALILALQRQRQVVCEVRPSLKNKTRQKQQREASSCISLTLPIYVLSIHFTNLQKFLHIIVIRPSYYSGADILSSHWHLGRGYKEIIISFFYIQPHNSFPGSLVVQIDPSLPLVQRTSGT